jgi:predicted alpha/beta superfamily hydrolase
MKTPPFPTTSPMYQIGDSIEALRGNGKKWYSGVIQENGDYDHNKKCFVYKIVYFPDGDDERNVLETNIKVKRDSIFMFSVLCPLFVTFSFILDSNRSLRSYSSFYFRSHSVDVYSKE